MSKEQVEAVTMTKERPQEDIPQRTMSFGRFAFEVLVVAALLAGGMYLYHNHVITKEKKTGLFLDARDQMRRNDFVSLETAERSLVKILDMDRDDPAAISALAEINFWKAAHGLDTIAKAEEYVAQAKKLGSERADRFTTEAYLEIWQGKAPQAENEVRALLERDFASPKLAHALGWALMEQGKFAEATRILNQAKDADFSNIAIPMTLAEMSMRQGHDRAAVSYLRGIVKDSSNPNHAWAKGWLAALLAKNYARLSEPAKHIQELQERAQKAKEAEGQEINRFAMSPRALAMLNWAEGELALAMGNAQGAEKKADEALAKLPKNAPIMTLKARALMAEGKTDEGLAVYEEAIKVGPQYRGIKWALAEAKSEAKDDEALAIIDSLEKSDLTTKGPEYEIFRGEHFLRTGNLSEAKKAFTQAAELGDDAAILFGLAKVTFEEQKAKGSKADLEQVAEAFERTLEKRPTYPEAHEYMGEISLWNRLPDGAESSFKTAEAQYKKTNEPIAKVLAFYDRVIRDFSETKSPAPLAKAATKLASDWKKRRAEYMTTVLSDG